MGGRKDARVMFGISMVIFGTIGLFVRNINIASGELALYRAVFAAVLIGCYLRLTKQNIPWRKIKQEIPLLCISGVAMGLNWILLFEAYQYTTVSIATLSYYFAPVIVTLACPILFKEKMTVKQWICFLMSTVGIVMLTWVGDLSGNHSHLTGILFGLGAAVLYATVILCNKFIKKVEGLHRTFLQFLAAILVLIPYVWMTGGMNLNRLDGKGLLCLVIVGVVHTGINYCLYFSSLKELPGQKVSVLSYIDPLVAVMISVLILKEKMSLWQMAGGILILGFTLWNEIEPKKE